MMDKETELEGKELGALYVAELVGAFVVLITMVLFGNHIPSWMILLITIGASIIAFLLTLKSL